MLPKSVLIAGAGPAGLQAAIAAARNGHRVTVCEQSPQAGGQVRLAASVPNRAELGDMIRNQLTECRRLGVTIEYGIGVGSGLVAERRPDHVIVATGAEPQRPWWVPEDATTVADIRDVLEGEVRPFGDVMVIDEIGFHHADIGRRVVGRSRLRGRDRHAGNGRRPRSRRHARHGELVDSRHRQGHRAAHRPGADGDGWAIDHVAPPSDRRTDHELTGLGRARRAAASGRLAVPRARRTRA